MYSESEYNKQVPAIHRWVTYRVNKLDISKLCFRLGRAHWHPEPRPQLRQTGPSFLWPGVCVQVRSLKSHLLIINTFHCSVDSLLTSAPDLQGSLLLLASRRALPPVQSFHLGPNQLVTVGGNMIVFFDFWTKECSPISEFFSWYWIKSKKNIFKNSKSLKLHFNQYQVVMHNWKILLRHK